MSVFVKRIGGVLAIAIWAALAGGCAGVGPTTLPPQSDSHVQQTQSTNATRGNVRFAIGIKPKAKTARIAPQYVSPSTQSLQILIDGSNPLTIDLTSSSPNCSPDPKQAGAYICSASLSVPTGNHVFTVTTYDLTSAKGNVLSTNSTGTVFVKAIGTNMVAIVLYGAVQYVILTVATINPPIGAAVAIGLTANVEDADHNLIFGPAPFEHPVTLTTTDSISGALSKTTLSSPADTSGITLHYTGADVASITYSATAPGLPAANVIDAILTPGAPAKPEHLYVAISHSVLVFDTTNKNVELPAITGGGSFAPEGLAVDASGKLYVSNSVQSKISVFDTAHGNAPLPDIAGGGLNFPEGVAVDASGKLYVANYYGRSVSVFDTAHGNAALPAISGGGLNLPLAVAVDAHGKLYVANYDTVSVFDTAHGNTALPPITGGGLDRPAGVAVDAADKLYVANFFGGAGDSRGSISVFDTAHGNEVLPPITGSGLSYNGVAVVAVDPSGRLYVSCVNLSNNGSNGVGRIAVFDTAHGNAVMPAITSGDIRWPVGVAVH